MRIRGFFIIMVLLLMVLKINSNIKNTNKYKNNSNSQTNYDNKLEASSWKPLASYDEKITDTKIDFKEFYSNYYGHKIDDLEKIISFAREKKKKVVHLVGDSSLDNKYWILDATPVKAVNGYEELLDPPNSYPDISYHLNKLQADSKSDYMVINSAVEESTIGLRLNGNLLEQDKFVQKHLKEDDIIIASLGGNDIALSPTMKTIAYMLWLARFSSISNIKNGTAWGMDYFINMFKNQVKDYLVNLSKNAKPKKILVCMIYYPYEEKGEKGGWADFSLGWLGYNKNPLILQTIISSFFQLATSQIKIEGIEVIPIPLFDILDPKKGSHDYVERVEPSDIGGEKMAQAFNFIK